MTKCIKDKLAFPSSKGKKIEVAFAKEEISSDGGVLLLREIDRKLNMTQRLSKVTPDDRDQSRVVHSLQSMLGQRIYGIALGYEDLNDHDSLRNDPSIQTAVDRDDVLASSPTLCRLENTADRKTAVAYHELMIELFIESYKEPPREIILDFDATDNTVHGQQEKRSYHGYYDAYCFLPLHVFCNSQLLVSYLRPSNQDGAKHAWAILALLVKRIRASWPNVNIIFRADSGFCRHQMLGWCEKHDVIYYVGLAQNKRLNLLTDALQEEVIENFNKTNEKQREYTQVQYAAKTWRRQRRIIAKVEHCLKGDNRRYVVTNDIDEQPEVIYRDIYCGRGNMENRIKEIKCEMFSERTSCHAWWPNQFRLLLSSMAYILVEATRRIALKNTELGTAQVGTIRLRLYKIGAIIFRNTRRIQFLLSSNYPKQSLFFQIARKLIPS